MERVVQLCSVLCRALIWVDLIPFHVVVTSFSTILVMTQQGRKHQLMQGPGSLLTS